MNNYRIAIIFAAVIYAKAARVIWHKRKLLDGFLNPLNESPFTNDVTTEIEITHETRPIVDDAGKVDGTEPDPYSVRIETKPVDKPQRPLPAAFRMRSISRDVAINEVNAEAWLYARVAFLFFLALIITWVSLTI